MYVHTAAAAAGGSVLVRQDGAGPEGMLHLVPVAAGKDGRLRTPQDSIVILVWKY